MLAGCVAGEAETKILGQAGDVRDDEGEEEPSRLTWFLLAGFEGKGEEGKERVFVVLARQVQPSRERGRTLSEWRRTSSLWERQPNCRLHYRGSAADPLEKKEAGCARPANLKKKDQGAGERARSDKQRMADRPPAGAVRHRTDPTESDATALSAILPQAM